MKKAVFIIFALVLSGAVFAKGINLSFGGGFKGGMNDTTITQSIAGESTETTMNGLFGTVVGFFDATYVKVEIGYTFFDDSSYHFKKVTNGLYNISRTGLNFTLHAKYPFSFREGEFWYPFLGLNYFKTLSAEYQNRYNLNRTKLTDLNKHDQFRLEGGLGADKFVGNIFFRIEMLIAYTFANEYQEDIMKNSDDKYSNYSGCVSFQVGYKL